MSTAIVRAINRLATNPENVHLHPFFCEPSADKWDDYARSMGMTLVEDKSKVLWLLSTLPTSNTRVYTTKNVFLFFDGEYIHVRYWRRGPVVLEQVDEALPPVFLFAEYLGTATTDAVPFRPEHALLHITSDENDVVTVTGGMPLNETGDAAAV